ncbi:hypothetical protein K2X30_13300 [bacterium]|nr:hypothetical protein [bacterium]
MKKTPTPQEWTQEFQEFMGADEAQVPKAVSDSILARVHKDLNPSSWLVFTKLSAIHTVMGFIMLLFCPQFGLGFTNDMGLMALFMRFGDQACMLGCGAVFMSGSALTASLVLRSEEIRVIRKTELLQISSLALLSMGVFICAGVGVVASLGAFWILGSILGGLGTFELGWALRRRLQAKSYA